MIPRPHIGIDFDNTIVNYGDLFFKSAFDLKLISGKHSRTKGKIRDSIRSLPNGESKWQTLQAQVYGSRLTEANIMEGFEEFVMHCRKRNVFISIISHKTEYPSLYPDLNLRKTADKWLHDNRFFHSPLLGFKRDDIFFESTRKDKIKRIKTIGCTHFIDDLVEVLNDSDFPVQVQRFLFSPYVQEEKSASLTCLSSWHHAKEYFLEHEFFLS